jgi:aconitate hydratase
MGMLAIGAGGLEVALAMAGKPFYFKMPKIWGVRLLGKLPDWVSAKDVILEMLRRHNVDGGVGKIIEYYGPGLEHLSAMDRHVIANMGAELGATSSIFPSDHVIKKFFKLQRRENDWVELSADNDADYDQHEEIDLSKLEPLIALPGSPGNVVPVRDVAGRKIYQSMIGSSANPGLRDFAIAALVLDGKQVCEGISFDVNPASRQTLEHLTSSGLLAKLIHAGARIHQAGCNGCIGMGQAPATGKISLRTVPRNFPGRSGTREDQVYLCSPETAAASAITGVITDPRDLGQYPRFIEPDKMEINSYMVLAPAKEGETVELEKGPNIQPLPLFEKLPDSLKGPVLLITGNDISTDDIMPAGARVLPYRSNIPEISRFVFEQLDLEYYPRVMKHQKSGSFIVGGKNYGQGSSREHAALAPRYLGVKAVIAISFARIHFQNLANFGILPLEFENPDDYSKIKRDDILKIPDIIKNIRNRSGIKVINTTRNYEFLTIHKLTDRQIEMVLEGGLINVVRKEL